MTLRNAPWSWMRRQWALGAPAGDTAVPTKPDNLVASDVTAETLTLTWGASADNVGVVSYRVEYAVDGDAFAWLATVTAPTVTLDVTGLTASTAYRFRVLAEDAAGNQSAWEPDATGLLVTTAVARRTFLRLDGVSQHALNDSGVATAVFPGGSPNAAAGTVTFVSWVRVEIPDKTAYWLFSTSAGAEARGWYVGRGVIGTDPAIYDYRRREVGGTSLMNANTVYSASPWEGPGWRMTAHVLRPDSVQQYLAGSIGSPMAYDPAVFVHPAGKWFVLGARIDGATGPALQVGTTWAGDIRAPAIYTSLLTEAQLQAIEAAGPTYDHAAAGAAGWWPGDGDTYPTLRNLGTAGSAWDLTLKNGSQAMIMEE